MREAAPAGDCALCPRLAAFRNENRASEPLWHNAPVPSFGPMTADFLIVGLAPGRNGANRTGRPFTGDYAGDLLYATLLKFGFAAGEYGQRRDDGLALLNTRITNAVRCVPPENKPTTDEEKNCNGFLAAEIAAVSPRAILCLGNVSHRMTLKALGLRVSAHAFAHGAVHPVRNDLRLFDSYHCSRYNTNTGRLTPPMFENIFRAIAHYLKK